MKAWERQGIQFDEYHIYETAVPQPDFWKGVPISKQIAIDYRQRSETGSVVNVIQEILSQTFPDDYVLLQLEFSDNHDAELEIW
eukprot:CAMPEP_0178897350 /NCGR_PEP_ID=MMETSP0786-20121207/1695_1 /TAXON_ID=186022 /ORGANISM="Thalassionema frauenfeldii, Strain CCMP 1798" /LENGTH=83 /DNA_ID=CAMNT_0020567885 /DNA_START=346 /DNA_END=594 /DNA_ORIENTATION=-